MLSKWVRKEERRGRQGEGGKGREKEGEGDREAGSKERFLERMGPV